MNNLLNVPLENTCIDQESASSNVVIKCKALYKKGTSFTDFDGSF